jgi:hypothetical protein
MRHVHKTGHTTAWLPLLLPLDLAASPAKNQDPPGQAGGGPDPEPVLKSFYTNEHSKDYFLSF